MKIVFATHNVGKLKEMKALLQDLDAELVSAEEVGVHEEPIEDEATFADNALKKARFVAEQTREWSLADDSGLCIDALQGKPGVLSARWAGEKASDDELVSHTLAQLENIPLDKRSAYFETALALVAPGGRHWIFTGRVKGRIADSPRGVPRPKLVYDLIFIPLEIIPHCSAVPVPVQDNSRRHRNNPRKFLTGFIPNGYDKTFAEMSDNEKNSLSHRGFAFRQLKDFLVGMLNFLTP